jgi:hypothetical protein
MVSELSSPKEPVDLGDRLSLYAFREAPDRYEVIVRQQLELADQDATVARLLSGIYIHREPAAAFEAYCESLEFQKIFDLLRIIGASPESTICEIGGGPGFVAWALNKKGFGNVSLLEPNNNYYTGTGYLASSADAANIKIWNDINDWNAASERYDVILTRNCIHHFPNLSYTAACIRRRMNLGGQWLAWREPFAESSRQLYGLLEAHPYSSQYGLYEYAYPVAYYVDAFSLAGLELAAVVPCGYARNALICADLMEESKVNRAFTGKVDYVLRTRPRSTVRHYHVELFSNRYLRGILGPRKYSFPSALLFKKFLILPGS